MSSSGVTGVSLEDYLLPALVVLAVLTVSAVVLALSNRYLYEIRRKRREREWARVEAALRRVEEEPEGSPFDALETGRERGRPLEQLEETVEDVGDQTRVALTRRVKEAEEPGRTRYLEAISRNEDLDSLSRQALRGPSTWGRVRAIEILGALEREETLGVLERCLRDRDPEVAYYAARALSGMEDRRAAGELLDLLGTGRINPKLLVAMLEAFPAPIDDLVRERLQSGSPEVRVWAATLLEVSSEAESVRRLVRTARDPDPDVRSAAVRSLASIGHAGGREALPDTLQDEVWFVRAGAAQATGRLGASELSEELFRLLGDGNWWVRQNAKTALLALCPEVEGEVVEHLASEDRFARNMVVEILDGCGTVGRKVEELEEDPDSEETLRFFELLLAAEGRGTIESAARHADPEARKVLEELLDTARKTSEHP